MTNKPPSEALSAPRYKVYSASIYDTQAGVYLPDNYIDRLLNYPHQNPESLILNDICPACNGSLDTGYECNDCQRDWPPIAQLLNAAPKADVDNTLQTLRDLKDSKWGSVNVAEGVDRFEAGAHAALVMAIMLIENQHTGEASE